MTAEDLKDEIDELWSRDGSNRISSEDLRTVGKHIVDFAAAQDVEDSIPDWSAGLTFQTDGSDNGKYCKHPDTAGKKRIFETKTDDNTGNEPPTNPAITENDDWEEISASSGSAIQEWTAGLYGNGLIIVYHSHSVYGGGLYKLNEPVRPFTSVNIEIELTAGTWELQGGIQYFQGYYTSLANLQAAKPTGKPGDYALVDAGVSNDAQIYVWDDDDDDWVLSSGGVVPDATSSVKGIAKLYPSTGLGTNTDGAPDQNAVKTYVDSLISAAAGGEFEGEIDLSKIGGTYYDDYNVAEEGSPVFSFAGGGITSGWAFLRFISDGATTVDYDIFTGRAGVPDTGVLDAGSYEFYFLKTTVGVSISIIKSFESVDPTYSDTANEVFARITGLTTEQKNIIATFINSQASAEGGSGNWELLDEFWMFEGLGSDARHLTGWKQTAGTLTSGNFTSGGLNKGTNSGFVFGTHNAKYSQNDAIIGFYSKLGSANLNLHLFDVNNAGPITLHNGTDTIRLNGRFNSSGSLHSLTGETEIKTDFLYHLQRLNSSEYRLIRETSVLQTRSDASGAVPSGTLIIGEKSVGGNEWVGLQGAFWVGAGIGFNLSSWATAYRTMRTALLAL